MFPCPRPSCQAANNPLGLPQISAQMSPPLGSRCLVSLSMSGLTVQPQHLASFPLSITHVGNLHFFPSSPLNLEPCEDRAWARLCHRGVQHCPAQGPPQRSHPITICSFIQNFIRLSHCWVYIQRTEDRCSYKNLYMNIHGSTIQNGQKVETAQMPIHR